MKGGPLGEEHDQVEESDDRGDEMPDRNGGCTVKAHCCVLASSSERQGARERRPSPPGEPPAHGYSVVCVLRAFACAFSTLMWWIYLKLIRVHFE